MNKLYSFLVSLALLLLSNSAICLASVPGPTGGWLRENYTKREVYIPARDGIRLHTSVYEPADSLPHPVIIIRARYRHSLSAPEPVTPGERTAIDFTLNDIAHIFRKGHRIVVQIQSSWFPITAMSPQFFQDNPYAVSASDYRRCEIKVWSDSRVVIPAS
ncbi:MAG: hypothetical protein J6X71_05555 [Bacteroidales bacterium]|nr:hypothetical protein [Bacteroidales bacterium]